MAAGRACSGRPNINGRLKAVFRLPCAPANYLRRFSTLDILRAWLVVVVNHRRAGRARHGPFFFWSARYGTAGGQGRNIAYARPSTKRLSTMCHAPSIFFFPLLYSPSLPHIACLYVCVLTFRDASMFESFQMLFESGCDGSGSA